MLPKELFLSTLEKIQKQEARIDEFNTALSKICDGFPVFDSENQYLIALRELLKYTMQDQYDYIGWWLYEAPGLQVHLRLRLRDFAAALL